MENQKPETKKHPAYIQITDENRDELLEFYYKNRESGAFLCEKPGVTPQAEAKVIKAKWLMVPAELNNEKGVIWNPLQH